MRPRLLLASAEASDHLWLQRCAGASGELVVVPAADAAAVVAQASDAAVIVLGEHVRDASADEVARLLDGRSAAPRVRIGDPRRLAWPAAGAVHVVSPGWDDRWTLELLSSLAHRRPIATARPAALEDAGAARSRERAFAASRRLAATVTLADAELAAITAILDLVAAERAHCLFHDARTGRLWSAERDADGGRRPADRGLAGWAAWTGGGAAAARAEADPRWFAAVDDPAGRGDERVLVAAAAGPDHQVHAVLIAVRGARAAEFGAVEVDLLRELAGFAGPLLAQLAGFLAAASIAREDPPDALFRPEAALARSQARWGDVVRVSPAWIRWVYWALVGVLAAMGALVVLGRIDTHSRGPAVIRMSARREVAAPAAGNVLAVTPAGTPVEAGDLLVRLDQGGQAAEVARLEAELEARVRERLLAPGSPAAGDAVSRARGELERARDALAGRQVLSPTGGVVGDVRVRAGQHVEAGDLLASVAVPGGDAEVIAFLPGGDRPRLRRGQPVRLALTGYRDAHLDLALGVVAAEAMGAEEARRYVGDLATEVDLRGPVVMVRARAPDEFVAGGEAYRFVDGMTGAVEVEVDSERIIHALIPGRGR